MTRWTLRAPDVGDAEPIAAIGVRSWQAAYAGIIPQHVLDGLEIAPRAARLRERYRTGDHADGYVAVGPGGPEGAGEPGGVVGYCWFGPHRDDEHRAPVPGPGWGEVYAIYVDPVAWGTGAGSALMRAALADLDPAPVAVWVLEENHLARTFYERCGFRPDGATQTYAAGRLDIPEVRYTLPR